MNTNLKNCPKCGHFANDTAAACVYCGAIDSAGDPSLQTGNKKPVEATPYPEQTPLMRLDEPLPDIAGIEEPVNTGAAVAEWLDPDDSDPPPAAYLAERAPEPIHEPAPIKTEHESTVEISDHTQVIESNPEISPKNSESRMDNHQAAAEVLEEEPISLQVPESEAKTADLSDNAQQDTEEKMETDAAAEQSLFFTEFDLLKSGDNEPSESADLSDDAHQKTEKQVETETGAEPPRLSPESDVLKSGDTEPSETTTPDLKRSEGTKFEAPPGSDIVLPLNEVIAETQTGKVPDAPLSEADNTTAEPPAVLDHEAPQEAILLPLDEIVQPPAKEMPGSVGELAGKVAEIKTGTSPTEVKSEILSSEDKVQTGPEATPKKTIVQSVASVLKIEKAAQELAEAVKKQKAAMAEARALKKQKLIRSKAQTEKRKEETLVEAKACKKQKAAQAGIETSKKEIAAQSISKTKHRQGMIIQGLKAHTKMQALLKKYANQAIGINYDNSADIKAAELVAVNDEFFSVSVNNDTLQYSYPLNTILAVIEGKDGVGSADPEKKEKFNAVIKVCPLVLS